MNILGQHPDLHPTPTSGLLGVLLSIRSNWQTPEHQAQNGRTDCLKRICHQTMLHYHQTHLTPVDKCRGWLGQIEFIEECLGQQVKILVPVRDIREVLTSVEKQYQKAIKEGNNPWGSCSRPSEPFIQFRTLQGRCRYWMQGDQMIGSCINNIVDAFQRNLGDRMGIVDFDVLTAEPKQTLSNICQFLEIDDYAFDFDNVEQLTTEDDRAFGFSSELHSIRQKIEHIPYQHQIVLKDMASEYEHLSKFWKRYL